MGSRYWVGGTNSWNGTAGTKWALISGGSGGQTEPTATDDVHFDGASGAVTVTIATTTALAISVDFTGFTGTLAGSTAMTISGSLTLGSGMTITWTGTLTFNNTTGTASITSNTKSLDSPITFNGVGGTFSLADTLITGSTRTVTLTNGTFTLNNQNMTCGLFSSANANIRTLTLGTGNTLTLNGVGAITPFDLSTTTNLTFTAGSTTIIDLTGVTASTRTISTASLTTIPSIKISGGSGAITFTNVNCLDLTFTNSYSGTIANQTLTIRGSLTLSIAATYSAGANVWTFTATSTGKLITTNNKTTDFPFTFNGVGGGWTLVGDLISGATRTIILTAGSFNDGSYNVTVGIFQSNNSNVRTLTMGTGNTWTLNATTASLVLDIQTVTNLTFTAGSTTIIDLTGVTSNTRTISTGSLLIPSIKISGGSSAITFTNVNCLNLTFTSGYSGTIANQTLSFRGSVTLVSTAAYTAGANAWTYVGTSGIGTWTSAGKTTDWPITINGAGGTLQLADAFVHGATRTITLTAGTFDANSVSFTLGFFSSANSNVRTIATGTGTWTFPTTGTVWNTSTSTNLTITGTATLDLTANSATARTITGGNALLPSIRIATGSYAPTLTSVNCLNLIMTSGWTGTIANQTVTIRGNIALSSTATYTAGANAWTWANTSGTVTFTANGKTMDWPLIVNGVGGIHQLADAFVHGATRTITLTNGTLNFSSFTHTLGFFSSANSNVRTIATGTSTINFPTTGTVWNTSTSTNLTITGTGTIGLTANSATARTITGGDALLPSLSMATGSFNPTFTNCNFLNFINTSGWTGTMTNQTLTIRGNITLSSNGTYSSGSNIWTWANTSGTVTFTSNGESVFWPLVINGTAIHQIADSFVTTNVFTLTSGTLDTNDQSIVSPSFVSSNTNVRNIILGATTWTLNSTGTVWDTSTSTNLTWTPGTGTLDLTNATAVQRCICNGSFSLQMCNIKISAGSGYVFTVNVNCNDFNLDTGFTGYWAATHDITVRGNLTLPLNGNISNGTTTITLANTTGTKTITSNGKILYRHLTINASGGTHQLSDDLTLGSVLQPKTLTLTAGTLDANNFVITADRFVSSNTNIRAILLGTATHVFTGAGTMWDCTTSTNLTITPSSSTLKFTDGTSSTKTFQGGDKTYNNIKYSGSGSGIFLTVGNNTFYDFATEKVA